MKERSDTSYNNDSIATINIVKIKNLILMRVSYCEGVFISVFPHIYDIPAVP